MVALRQFRNSRPSFADLVPYAGLVDDGVLLLKDGSVMAGWYFAGPDSESSTNIEARKGEKGAARLSEIRHDRMNDAISAIVTVNTLAGTIGAGFAGVQAARLFGDAAVGVVSVLLTILLLVLSEIAPKTFAATHSATLAPYVGHTLFYLIKIMTPVLMLTRAVTDRLSPDGPENLTRRELAAIIVQAPEEGAISGPEAELLSSMVYAHNVTLKGKRIGIPT